MDVFIEKLEALKIYINRRIDYMPEQSYIPFRNFCFMKYPERCEGTPEYIKLLSTHCYYCEKEFKRGQPKTIDHFIPKKIGGLDSTKYNRYVICCETCNQAKAGLPPRKFAKEVRNAITFCRSVGNIEQKRLPKVLKNIERVISEYSYRIKNPIYFVQKWTVKKPPIFFSKQIA